MRFEQHLKQNGVDRGLAKIMLLIAKKSRNVQKAFFTHSGVASTKNIHGEQQMELDKFADSTFLTAMEKSGLVRTVASEEQDDIIEIVKAKGSFGVTLDPLDGSSLIKTNLAVGTIAGFFNEGDVMEKGSKMDGAMYIVYGPLTSLVYTAKSGVHEFVMNSAGNFVLKKENIQIPQGKIYCPGGIRSDWIEGHKKFIEDLESQNYKLRFSGGFVPDFSQILSYGGIFCYPALKSSAEGKLRLIFEANPMALIAKEAGGAGSNGAIALHDIKPQSLAQRTPLYLGGKKEIELARKHLSV
ncbi:MAG TPA: class 1 fructose-bisphosphatase [archaeon]|nr:class 1 fructose-bisphosphatase [archaeon]